MTVRRARLLYAASDTDPDILYATGFFAPDLDRPPSSQVRPKRAR